MVIVFLMSIGQIFLVLCISNNFGLYSGHLKYYVVELTENEQIVGGQRVEGWVKWVKRYKNAVIKEINHGI